MATDLLPADLENSEEPIGRHASSSLRSTLEKTLRPLASLKLTVTLFALAIFLVFAGTLAQARHDIWWVLHNYFRTPLAWIEFNTFFPPAWFSEYRWLMNLPGAFPFPGGFTIGSAMAVNLLAAHGVRFKIQAKGNRLWTGVAVIAGGCLLTWLVIVAGPDKDGSQASSPVDWITLWKMFLVGLAGGCVGIAYSLTRLDASRKLERGVLAGIGCALLLLLGFLLFHIDPQFLNPSAMRILWQLLKAEAAALVLLTGCLMVFRKCAGVVLLHAGIGLIMANELVVHFLHKEEQMSIEEGRTANYAVDIRSLELAVVDKNASEKEDEVTVVPEKLLKDSLETGKPVSSSKLPFDVRLTKFFENSDFTKENPAGPSLADSGSGRDWPIIEQPALTGADSGERINQPSGVVQLIDKSTGQPLGTYFVTTLLSTEQKVAVGDKTYNLALRFERDYKPYTMHLNEVRGDNYLGTNTPRNYSSDLQLSDPARGVDRRVAIKMNEPLRYGGETFYQSGYHPADPEKGYMQAGTTLQVVKNFGWMIPYVACMIVATGLLATFGQTLARFLRRREETQFGRCGWWSTWLRRRKTDGSNRAFCF